MTIISALPFSLTNGTTADATQVMANFNQIVNNVNANGAHNGANSDITSLSGLATPLSVGQGGTGAAAAGATLLANLGLVPFLRGWKSPNGLILSNDGVTPNSILDVSAGAAADSTATVLMSIAAFTKSTGGAWVAGSGANGMGVGLTIAPTATYHVFLIQNAGAADIYFDTLVTGANAPAGTTALRRIGSIKTDGSSHIRPFSQRLNEFWWQTPGALDLTATVTNANRTLITTDVPAGIIVKWFGNLAINAGVSGAQGVILTDPANADVASNITTTPLSTLSFNGAATTTTDGIGTSWTDTSGRIGARAQQSTNTIQIQTLGWVDTFP